MMKSIFLFLLILILFSEIPFTKFILKYSDELLLLLSIFIIFYFNIKFIIKNKKIKLFFLFFIMYLFYQYINYYVSPFNLKILPTMLQSIINLKLFIISSAVFHFNKYKIISIEKIYLLMILLFLIGWFLNAIIGESWNNIFDYKIQYRYGILRPCGFFGNTAQLGYVSALSITTILLLLNKKEKFSIRTFKKKFYFFILIDLFLATLLTVRKGIFMSIPFGFTLLKLIKGYKKYIFLFFTLLFFFLLYFLVKDTQLVKDTFMNFRDMINPETSYIRGMMFYYGWWLFYYFFPLGSGSGTFGTVMSQYNTFEIYNFVGFDMERLFYSESNKLTGVYDSGISSMVAENGFIGIIIIGLFIFYYFKFFKRIFDSYNYMIFSILTWFAIILSLTEPNWQNGLFTAFYVINLLYIYTKNEKVK